MSEGSGKSRQSMSHLQFTRSRSREGTKSEGEIHVNQEVWRQEKSLQSRVKLLVKEMRLKVAEEESSDLIEVSL